MKDILSKLLIFAAGAGIGSAVTWKIVKTKYERIAQEEIDNVKEYYRKKADESESAKVAEIGKKMVEGFVDGVKDTPKEESVTFLKEMYNSIITSEGYSDSTESGEEVADTDDPYIIDADEFGDSYEYDTDSLVYYADGILATETDDVIDDIERIIGTKNLTQFDDDNVIFVRNDRTRHDYEVTREDRTFAEVAGIHYPPEGE